MLSNTIFAQFVEKEYAKLIATNFYSINNSGKNCKCTNVIDYKYDEQVVFYIFDFDNSSHIIIPACKSLNPIFAYSFEEVYNPLIEESEVYLAFIENFSKVVIYFNNTNIQNIENQQKWDLFESKQIQKTNVVIGPMVTIEWGQAELGNTEDDCPGFNAYVEEQNKNNDDCGCDKCTLGCGALAMGQVMRYWQFCLINGYNYWDWSLMLPIVDAPGIEQDHIAFFLYTVAQQAQMSFCYAGCASFNRPYRMEDALHFFGYGDAELRRQQYYTNNRWNEMIQNDLDAYNPVIYMGFSDGINIDPEEEEGFGSHAFIIDGYDSDGKYHINWGGTSHNNTYYSLDSLLNSGYDYNWKQRAIFNIYPTETNTVCTDVIDVCDWYYNVDPPFTDRVPIANTLQSGDKTQLEECRTIYHYSDVTYKAYSQIRLRQGFKVENGAKFRAYLTDCPETKETKVYTKSEQLKVEEEIQTSNFEIFPNPFSNSVTINYIISQNAESTIKIYNIFGQLQVTVLNDIKETGVYSVKYDLSNLAAGIYLCTFQNGDNVESVKIVKAD
jgi:hypothetical protein